MRRRISRFLRNSEAATAVEYAVMLALVLLTVLSAVALLGRQTQQTWVNNNASLSEFNFGS